MASGDVFVTLPLQRQPPSALAKALQGDIRGVVQLSRRALRWTFNPGGAIRQLVALLVLASLRQVALFSWRLLRKLSSGVLLRAPLLILPGLLRRAREDARLSNERRRCKDYASFVRLGEELDQLWGKDRWKAKDDSSYYDSRQLRARLERYRSLRAARDVEGIMFRLRGEMHRRHFAICNPSLWEVCRAGTKHILEEYVGTVCTLLRWLAFEHRAPESQTGPSSCAESSRRSGSAREACVSPISGTGGAAAGGGLTRGASRRQRERDRLLDRSFGINMHMLGHEAPSAVGAAEKLAFLMETRHAFGRSALLLSGGASLGLYHLGVVKALHLQGLLPRVVSGSSAGSIVCGLIGTRTDAQLNALWRDGTQWTQEFDLNFFDAMSVKRFLQKKGQDLFNADHLGSTIRRNIGDLTFLEAFDKTGRIINIAVSSQPGSTRLPMLLNYLTTPRVVIWSAVLASCALPGIFMPRELLTKDMHGNVVPYIAEGVQWRDGSIENDLPMARLAELFNINNFIVSQVNPQARLLTGGGGYTLRGSVWRVPGFVLVQFLKRELKQYLKSIAGLILGTVGRHVSPWEQPVGFSLVGLLTQEYEGDITIYNGPGILAIPSVLSNPTEDMMQKYVTEAEQETWRHLPQIAAACAIEFTMDEIIRDLRAEIVRGTQGSMPTRLPSFYKDTSVDGLSSTGLSKRDGTGSGSCSLLRLRRNSSVSSYHSMLDVLAGSVVAADPAVTDEGE